MNDGIDPGGLSWQAFLASGVAIAALEAIVLATLAAWFGRKGQAPSGPRWGATLGLGLGALIAYESVREAFTQERPGQVWDALRLWWKDGGAFPLFPVDAYLWIPWVVLAATVVGLLDGDFPAPRWARWENRAILVGLLLWLVPWPLMGEIRETRAGEAVLIGLGVGLIAWIALLDARAERLGPAMPLVLLIPSAALPVVLMRSEAGTVAALAGGFAAVLASLWVVSWGNRRMALGRGAIPVFAVAFAGLTLVGTFGNDMPRPIGLLLALAPLASIIDRAGPVARLSRWKVAAVRLVAVAITTGIAVAWAYLPASSRVAP